MSSRIILLTGAAGGFGRALSSRLQSEGCQLVLLDKDRRGLEQLHDQLIRDSEPDQAPALYPMDLVGATPDHYSELAVRLQQEFGRLDGVVHAAAQFDGLTPLELMGPEYWLATLQANLTGPWALSCACLPLLKQQSKAVLSFVLEDRARVGQALWGAYGVSKIGLQAMAGQWQQELEDGPVQVITYHPGPMATPLRATAYHAESPDEHKQPETAAAEFVDLLAEAFRG